ncbi:hypothetical protein JHK82_024678 [Glycine max]|nr:hypothetical protein JHK85_025278 [Glycine max]KAG5133490.1 hypothetical protein JHK82_024678 [Glycine max]
MVIIEVQMTEVGTEYVVKSILTTHKSGAPILPKGEFGTGINPDMDNFSTIEVLDLSGSSVASFPTYIKNLLILRELNLKDCKKLVSLTELPPSLSVLRIDDCRKLMSLPELPCTLYVDDVKVWDIWDGWDDKYTCCENLISDVIFRYPDISRYDRISEVYDRSCDIAFVFKFDGDKESIKGFWVLPLYATASGFKQETFESESIDGEQLPALKRRRA